LNFRESFPDLTRILQSIPILEPTELLTRGTDVWNGVKIGETIGELLDVSPNTIYSNFLEHFNYFNQMNQKLILQEKTTVCLPLINPHKKQYIVAYGLFMQAKYRLAINPAVSPVIPVHVKGYSRFWGSRVPTVAVGGTFLALKKDPLASLDAVIFSLNNASDISNYESTTLEKDALGFCRQKVLPAHVQLYAGGPLDSHSEIWVYVSKADNLVPPDAAHPVSLSYVDIFLEGCLEIEQQYGLTNFVENCINSTGEWTPFWVNDRIFPRRPFLYSPYAEKFDTALKKLVPAAYSGITVE